MQESARSSLWACVDAIFNLFCVLVMEMLLRVFNLNP